jgi:hypothetical protein
MAHVCGFNAVNPVPAFLEIAQKRPVIGTDVDNKAFGAKREQTERFFKKLSEIVSEDFGCPAGVWIFGRKEYLGIHDKAQLHKLAVWAQQDLSRVAGLFRGSRAYGVHLVDRREVSQKYDRLQIRVIADLAAVHHHA